MATKSIYSLLNFKTLFIFTVLSLQLTFSHGQGISDLNLPDKTVQKWIDDISNRLSVLKDELVNDLDILTEERIEQIEILINNLKISLEGQLDTKLNELDLNTQGYIYGIQDYLDNKFGVIENIPIDLDLITSSNLADLCSTLPNFICPDEKINYSVKYITGKFLIYSQARNEYIVEIGGNLINGNSDITLKVFDHTIPSSELLNSSRPNAVNFRIPASYFEQNFEDITYKKISASIEITRVTKGKRRGGVGPRKTITKKFSFPFHFFLLPKFPIYYEIVEKGVEKRWRSDPAYIKEKTLNMKRNSLDNEISFQFPAEERFNRLISYTILNREGPSKPWMQHTREDTYFCLCNPVPKFLENNTLVKFNCRGGRVSNIFVYKKIPFGILLDEPFKRDLFKLDEPFKRDLFKIPSPIFNDPPPYPIQTQFLYEKVLFRVAYDKLVPVEFSKDLPVIESSNTEKPNVPGYLGYGTHLTEPMRNNSSEYTIYLYPTVFRNKGERIILTSTGKTGTVEGILKVEVREENSGNSLKRLRIEISRPQ